MSSPTVFDLILSHQIPSWIIWENKDYVAFLTPFPSTPGLSVVIPKSNPGSYLFDLNDQQVSGLVLAAKAVAKLLEKALGVKRVAMVIEGTGVPYVHAKLYPLHGQLGGRTDLEPTHLEFYENYPGYLSTIEGPPMSKEELTNIQTKIKKAAKT